MNQVLESAKSSGGCNIQPSTDNNNDNVKEILIHVRKEKNNNKKHNNSMNLYYDINDKMKIINQMIL